MKHFLRALMQFFLFLYCALLWRTLKFVMRKVTGRCELQRICHNNKPGARRTLKIESSLKFSKSELLQTAVSAQLDSVEKIIDDIITLKNINPDANPQLGVSLQASLFQIVGYRSLVVEVERLRRESYDCENPKHEEMLLKLWKCLCPDTPLTGRISKQWCDIGFQGNDPKTDFRGMGILGLSNLLYYAEHDRANALQLLHDSQQPKSSKMSKAEWEKSQLDKAIGYSFAIVGINITDLAYRLLVGGALKTHLYNVAPEMPSIANFQQTFCYLMQEFHRFWMEEDPRDIMEFNRIRDKFHKMVLKLLRDPDTALCPHFSASDLHMITL
ncbi:ELMO domain-containing protein 1-like [Brienomyrus brachyistius]|uniref:ELMO domain-containing protein 1-like n=1 Tax=Brienomyrus brachyistius TaxID=42636 RepID=UPI0020B188C4|nr:ELMO domain-containing protein 1-like [Brienomyrus brachyistius]XP_048837065.1 ELMO domain-containing protein 1-like [Brienomyrus brachyistius]XP_048837066.1 ELMO domain-containing protein 1-like [Brienomyrus brachyistius]XP_048837067.1 ELMO domain-containing protein 1-like [Brienomyrus brachyistius]